MDSLFISLTAFGGNESAGPQPDHSWIEEGLFAARLNFRNLAGLSVDVVSDL